MGFFHISSIQYELGTAEADKTTSKAVLEVNNLKENTDYAWYAVIENASTGVAVTSVYEFTTTSNTQDGNSASDSANDNTENIEPTDNDNNKNIQHTGDNNTKDIAKTEADNAKNSAQTGDMKYIWILLSSGIACLAAGTVVLAVKKKEV